MSYEPIPAWKPGTWSGGGMRLLKARSFARQHLREILSPEAGK